MFEIITSASYWILTALWLVILWLYIANLRVSRTVDRTVSALLLILAIDAFRTLFESVYFGFYFNSLFGFLPISVYETLSNPNLLIVPKLLNIIAGLLVLILLIRHWMPRELRQRADWVESLKRAKLDAESQKEQAETESRKLESVLNAIPDAILVTDTERRIISINHGMQAVFGYSIDDLAGKKTVALYASEEDYEYQGQVRFNLSAEEKAAPYEVMYKHKDGHFFPGETLGIPVHTPAGDISGYIGVIRDITERKNDEKKLKLAASVFTHAREGIAITDATGSIIDMNDTFCEITGYERRELLGSNPSILHSGHQTPEFYASMWRSLIQKKYWTGEILNRRKDGQVMADLVTISAISDQDGVVQQYVGLFTDITKIKEHQHQLEHAAHYDALTNLPNRALLADRLKQAITQSQRRKSSVAVVYLDLDDFKAVNDDYGHPTGDRLLIDLSKRIQDTLREGDTLTRIGGDEFVAVLVDIDKMADCENLLRRILHAASQPILVNGNTLSVSASIGVTVYPQNDVEAEQLIRHADQAMYNAKQEGKNNIQFFDTVENEAILGHRQFIHSVHQALERQELVLYYQPKVNLESAKVVGFEALVRWQHPQRGLLLPDEFLPQVENHPISVDIGDWVIATALEQIRQWQLLHLEIAVSVNVSPRQMQADDFVTKISEKLSLFPMIPPNLLELEILESSAIRDISEVSEVMRDCLKIGVGCALDDFGTGYSSLEYLKMLPAEFLKIDKSFIRDMAEDPDDKTIVSAVIGLASSFRRTAIAEGVETVQQRRELLAMGCKVGQGFGIAHPMPAEEVPDWLRTWRSESHWPD